MSRIGKVQWEEGAKPLDYRGRATRKELQEAFTATEQHEAELLLKIQLIDEVCADLKTRYEAELKKARSLGGIIKDTIEVVS